MLNKNSIQPLYKQLMDIITQQIKNGTYKPGEKIPPEPELADLYHVSRITVRRTVEELCTQGYLIKFYSCAVSGNRNTVLLQKNYEQRNL